MLIEPARAFSFILNVKIKRKGRNKTMNQNTNIERIRNYYTGLALLKSIKSKKLISEDEYLRALQHYNSKQKNYLW